MKPRYRLNLDGSTSLVACSPLHFAQRARALPPDLTGIQITEIRRRDHFVRNVLDELRRGRSLKEQAARLGLSVTQLGRILRGTSGMPDGFFVLCIHKGFRLPEEAHSA